MKEIRFRVVTYNVHKCRGMDRKVRPDRIAEVLQECDADVIALQEVLSIPQDDVRLHQASYIATALGGYSFFIGETRRLRGGAYGNVTLSRKPVPLHTHYPLTSRREPRGCLRTDVQIGGSQWAHIFNLHLGTGFLERRKQAAMLLDGRVLLNSDLGSPRLVLGDFNEWTRGLASQLMEKHFHTVDVSKFEKRAKTYPGFMPVLHLDHIYFDSGLELTAFRVLRNKLTLIASDHLPLRR